MPFIFSTYIPPQRASSSWGFIMCIIWSKKDRRIKLRLKKEDDLEARTDELRTWCYTQHCYLSLVESINLADITFLGYIHFIERFLRRKKKISRLRLLRISNWGSKAKGYLRRMKSRVSTRQKRAQQCMYLCYCDFWETWKCEILIFWRVLESFCKVKKTIGVQLIRQYTRCPSQKVKASIWNKASITTIKYLILCANLRSQRPATNL